MNWIKTDRFFESTDYRQLLTTWIRHEAQAQRRFSYRGLARQGGFKSPNFIQLVVKGKRNLGLEGVIKLSRLMKIKGLERDYFYELVEFNQSKSLEERNARYRKLIKIKSKTLRSKENLKPIDDYEYLSNWLYVAVREFLSTHPEISTAEQIADSLSFNLKPSDVQKAVDFLESRGFIENREGRFVVKGHSLQSTDEVRSLSVQNHHEQVLDLAKRSLSEHRMEERDFGALTLSLTPDQFAKVKAMLKKFRTELREAVSDKSKRSDIYQLSLFLFPLSHIERKKP